MITELKGTTDHVPVRSYVDSSLNGRRLIHKKSLYFPHELHTLRVKKKKLGVSLNLHQFIIFEGLHGTKDVLCSPFQGTQPPPSSSSK